MTVRPLPRSIPSVAAERSAARRTRGRPETAGPAVDLVIEPVLAPYGPGWADAVESLDDADRHRLALTSGPAVRARFVTGRLALRLLAAARLGVPARDVRIGTRYPERSGPPDAPEVGTRDGRRLRAGLSHAADRVLVAVTDQPGLGVDLVEIDAAEFPGFDRTVLTRSERAATPASRRDRGWRARAWAAKEAVLKAAGRGPRLSPTAVELAAPGSDGETTAVLTGPTGPTPFLVTPVAAPDGLVAAVARPC